MRNVSGNKGKEKLKKAFQSAKTTDEMLKLLKQMESRFEEEDLGMEFITIARKFRTERSLDKVLLFGKRALKVLLKNQNSGEIVMYQSCEQVPSLIISSVLNMLGSVSLDLGKYDDCLSYLNWSDRILTKLDHDGNTSCDDNCVLRNLIKTHAMLCNVKMSMGRQVEAVDSSRKVLELRERLLEKGCIELGKDNEAVCEGYMLVLNCKEALPFCLKALEIYVEHLGCDSVEVAQIRRDLVLIYEDLGEYEKALEQNRLFLSIMERGTPCLVDLLRARTGNGNLLIALGRYEEAINVLKGVISQAPAEGCERAVALVSLARALCDMENFADAKQYLKIARMILENKGMNPIIVAFTFGGMSRLYEKMNYFETAISLTRRVLAMHELPKEILATASARLFSLVFLTKKEKELISYLEDMVEKMKENFGPDHSEVGRNYFNLGMVYMNLGQIEFAVKYLEIAKNILNVCLGPHHLVSLKIDQTLSASYASVKRLDPEIEIEQKVIEGVKGLGPSEQELLDVAVRFLNQMKKIVAEFPAMVVPQCKDSKEICATFSKFGISDDRKVIK